MPESYILAPDILIIFMLLTNLGGGGDQFVYSFIYFKVKLVVGLYLAYDRWLKWGLCKKERCHLCNFMWIWCYEVNSFHSNLKIKLLTCSRVLWVPLYYIKILELLVYDQICIGGENGHILGGPGVQGEGQEPANQ